MHLSRATLGLVLIAASCWIASRADAEDWPQWRGPRRDGTWNENGVIEAFSSEQIPIRWRAPIGGGYSGPTVAEGRVYVADRVTEPEEIERVHCFDWRTGARLWSHVYPSAYRGVSFKAGPRCSVLIDDGLAYSLGTMGHLHCYDAATGQIVWQYDLVAAYDIAIPIWGVSSHPIISGNMLIVQAGAPDGGCVVAFDKRSGEEQWRALDDPPSYSSPLVVWQAGKPVVVVWTGAHIAGIDPADGAVLWKYAIPPQRTVDFVVPPVVEGARMLLSSFYDGARLFQLSPDDAAVTLLWHRRGPNEQETDALHAMMCTPILDGDHIYGIDSYGQFRCLDAANGDRLWENLNVVPNERWANAHIVSRGEQRWLFTEHGELLIARLSPSGYEEMSRARLIEPTPEQLSPRRPVCWAHPAFAYRHIFARNDRELVCASLAAE